jgi:acetyl-CoA acetyltransferase
LQSIAIAADRVRSGSAEVMLAGGTESMSMVPMGGNKVSANPWLVDHYADSYLSMGLTAERVAAKYGITREQADAFSLSSHQKALAATQAGKFDEQIVPVTVTYSAPTKNPAKPEVKSSRELVADLRRSRRRYRHVIRPCKGTEPEASGTFRQLRHRRMPAGRDGIRPGLRHP